MDESRRLERAGEAPKPTTERVTFADVAGIDESRLRDRPAAGQSAGRTWTAKQLEVTATAVHAGVDGEPVELDPPLRFVIRPGTLRVRITSRQATV